MRPSPEILIVFAAIANGCASLPRPEAMAREFQALDADQKIAYLSIYPWLESAERRKALTDPLGYTQQWLEADPQLRADQLRDSAPERITGLSVRMQPTRQPAFTATVLATLDYRRAPSIDITEDSTWTLAPEGRATFINNQVVSRCASEGADLTVNFLGHFSKSISLAPGPDPLELRLKSRDALRGAESGTVYFELNAQCEGDSVDVSCAANWKTESPALEVTSCGKVTRRHLPHSESEQMETHFITATFRGKTLRAHFVFDDISSSLH